MIKDLIGKEFGTHRGLVRTVLAYVAWLLGPYRRYGRVDWTAVRRIVFVCRGNICRSAYAHYRYQALVPNMPVASFGLATTTGAPADRVAVEIARTRAVDLSVHKAIDLKDFAIADGDLLLVMEDRHIRALAPGLAGRQVQIALLGLWCHPFFALLYDPHTLSADYFATCFCRIDRAVERLASEARAQISG